MRKLFVFFLVIFCTGALINDFYAQSSVVMNEIYSRGTAADPDWIEIYNGSTEQVDISSYKIYDNGGQAGTKPKKEFPSGTIIPPNGFYVIVTDNTGDPSDFGLSSGGEQVWFEDAAGNIIDNVTFPTLDVTQSYGRIPDGGSWQILNIITRGSSNSLIKMNEIYSRGTAENPDWIEIYNASTEQMDISGYKIYDNGGQAGTKPKKEFPAGTVILPNGFYVIVTDDADASGFGLSSGGEEVWLEDASGNLIDNVVFSALDVTQSYGRIPDGGVWQILNTITRGESNVVVLSSYIKMNEIYSRGTAEDPDWIEIYNTSSEQIDISGYKIYDNGGQAGTKPKKEFSAGTIIPPDGFYVIVTDDSDASGFGLSSGGEEVWLEDAVGNVIDNVVFPALDVTQSYGRIPDGGEWQILNTITRGESNVVVLSSFIKMNEIYSRGTAEDPDWIEIYNTSSEQMDISGYKIYDNGGHAGTKPKKEFPTGTVIPPDGFYVIVTDDADASGFGLSSGGEEVWLEDAEGSVIDNVVFPALDVTQSYGRIPDGGEWQILNVITRGEPNDAGTDVEDEMITIKDYKLYQNFPNPFNPATVISYQIPVSSFVTLKVFDVMGKEVIVLVNKMQAAGNYSVEFGASNLSSGIYYYRLEANNSSLVRKMVLLR